MSINQLKIFSLSEVESSLHLSTSNRSVCIQHSDKNTRVRTVTIGIGAQRGNYAFP